MNDVSVRGVAWFDTLSTRKVEEFEKHLLEWATKNGQDAVMVFDESCIQPMVEEIREKDYNLTPSSYVGIIPLKKDTEPFYDKIGRLTSKLLQIHQDIESLNREIKFQLERIDERRMGE